MFSTGRVVLKVPYRVVLKVSYFKPAFNTDHTITPKIRTLSIFNESSIPVEEKRLPRETGYLISSFYSSNVVRICDSSIRQRIVSKYGCYHRDQNRQHLELSRRQQDDSPDFALSLLVAHSRETQSNICPTLPPGLISNFQLPTPNFQLPTSNFQLLTNSVSSSPETLYIG